MEVEKLKRKLRKKLRQIENLELLDRELNEEELDKLRKKAIIRSELATLVKETESHGDISEAEEEEEMKRSFEEAGGDNNEDAYQKRLCSDDNSDEALSYHDVPSVEKSSNFVEFSSEELIEATENVVDQYVEESKNISPELPVPIEQSSPKKTKDSNLQLKESVKHDSKDVIKAVKEAKSELKNYVKTNRKDVIKYWRKSSWKIDLFDTVGESEGDAGHTDLILSCDLNLDMGFLITASRDTTLKVWSLKGGYVVHSLRGHSSCVTGVRLCLSDSGLPSAVSAGQDCSLRLWDLVTGSCLQDTYTYNTITKLELLSSSHSPVTVHGTSGGKLQVFAVSEGRELWSSNSHSEAVTALTVRQDLVASGSSEGVVKLFKVIRQEGQVKALSCLFESENIKPVPGLNFHCRSVSSLAIGGLENSQIYIGDNGCNIKVLDWKKASLSKISNHSDDVGFTDCLISMDGLLIASTFDIDSGEGGINLFLDSDGSSSLPQYITSLRDEGTCRVLGLAGARDGNKLFLVSCGWELKTWEQLKSEGANNKLGRTVSNLTGDNILDSGTDFDDEDEDEDDIHEQSLARNKDVKSLNSSIQKPSSGFCNCILM